MYMYIAIYTHCRVIRRTRARSWCVSRCWSLWVCSSSLSGAHETLCAARALARVCVRQVVNGPVSR